MIVNVGWLTKDEKKNEFCYHVLHTNLLNVCAQHNRVHFFFSAKWIYSNTAKDKKKNSLVFCFFDHFGLPYSLFSCRHIKTYSILSLSHYYIPLLCVCVYYVIAYVHLMIYFFPNNQILIFYCWKKQTKLCQSFVCFLKILSILI